MNYRLQASYMPGAWIILACLLWFGALALQATPRYVVEPGTIENGKDVVPYNTWTNAATNIQWAVNAAAAGETVWVSNGTYLLTNTISITNGFTVRSVNGKEVTIVNGNAAKRCFYLTNINALVQGFTITNGSSSDGGGVYLRGGATVRDCLITGNKSVGWSGGGGVFIDLNGKVDSCSIIGNVVTGQVTGGGGVWCGSGIITNSTIALNSIYIVVYAGYSGGGGGVYLSSGGVVQNCVIATNYCYQTQWGGGAGVNFNDGGQVINSTIIGNSNLNEGVTRGGGVWIYNRGFLQGCVIAGNKSDSSGSGVGMNINLSTYIRNCTIVGGRGSSGLNNYGNNAGFLYMENCIIVSNYSYSGTLANWSIGNVVTNTAFTNSCTSPISFTAGIKNSGCIATAPAFVNYSAGIYRLANNSPCINTGTNRSWMTRDSVDLAGNLRLRFGRVDMGAYEWYPRVMVNGIPYEKIRFINDTEPCRIDGVQ